MPETAGHADATASTTLREGLIVQPLPEHLAPTAQECSVWGFFFASWAPTAGQDVVFDMGAVYWIAVTPDPADDRDTQIESALAYVPLTDDDRVHWGELPNLIDFFGMADEHAEHARTVWALLTAVA